MDVFLWNARARNTDVEATLNHPFPAQASYWQPTGSDNVTVFAQFHENGTQLRQFFVPNCGDINHVQLVENETRAVISCRLTDSIINYDILQDRVVWTAGGENGTFTVSDGTVTLSPGMSYWAGQHNVEYVGDDTYLMFDNAFALNGAGNGCDVGQLQRLLSRSFPTRFG